METYNVPLKTPIPPGMMAVALSATRLDDAAVALFHNSTVSEIAALIESQSVPWEKAAGAYFRMREEIGGTRELDDLFAPWA